MRVFAKKKTDRGRKLSSELFGSTHNDDDNETRFETIIRPPTTEEEVFSLSEDDKPESTSTATSSSTSTTNRNPRVAKRKSIETSTSKKTSFDTSDSDSEKDSDDSDFEVKKKKKKKQKQTKKKRNSRTSQQDEEVDEDWDKQMKEYVQKANKFFGEVDATKLQKANLKEEEELLSKQAEKEILENAKKEQEAVKDAQNILKSQKQATELQREILEGSSSSGVSSGSQLTSSTVQQTKEEKQNQVKRQEYERYCRSVEGIMPPMTYEEYLLDADTLIPASEVTDLDDLDRV